MDAVVCSWWWTINEPSNFVDELRDTSPYLILVIAADVFFQHAKINCSPNRLQTNKQTWMLSSVVNDINNKFIAFNLVCWWTLRYPSLSYRCQEQFVFWFLFEMHISSFHESILIELLTGDYGFSWIHRSFVSRLKKIIFQLHWYESI